MPTTNRPPEPPRLGVPDWVSNQAAHTSTYQQMWAILGEQPEWGYAIPWVFRALVVRRGVGLVGEGGSSSLDLGQDVVGWGLPDEGFGIVVPVLDPGLDRFDELVDAVEGAAA